MTVDSILASVNSGTRLSEQDAAVLLSAEGADIWKIAAAADARRKQVCGDDVTYVRNMNIHLTNICKNRCGLCAFGTSAASPDAYFFTDEEFRGRIRLAKNENVTEICYLAGIHPAFTVDSYVNIIKAFHDEIPDIHVHGCSPDEILFAATRSGISTKEALQRLKDAGLNSVQGTAADLIKLAMVKVDRALKAAGLKTKMILQIHDELLFDVPKDEVEQVKALVKREMEGAMSLGVPLEVSVGVGANWLEAH